MLILSPGIYNPSEGTPKTDHAQGSHRGFLIAKLNASRRSPLADYQIFTFAALNWTSQNGLKRG